MENKQQTWELAAKENPGLLQSPNLWRAMTGTQARNKRVESRSLSSTLRRWMSGIGAGGRDANPIVPGMADVVTDDLYDRTNTANGATTPVQFQLFTVPIGQGGKTLRDTNMQEAGKLPAPQLFNAQGLGLYFAPNTVRADYLAFTIGYTVSFVIGDKEYARGPAFVFPGGAGTYGFSTQNAEQIYQYGQAIAGNYFDLRLPANMELGQDPDSGERIVTDGITGLTILQNQNFAVNLNADAGFVVASPTQLNVYGILWGIRSRGVQ